MLLEHRDGLGVQPAVALAEVLLQHDGGLCTEQLIAAVLDLPSRHFPSPLEPIQCLFSLLNQA